ncbi:PH domain-containing protein [Geodermatophilus sp. SYSU D00703]
MEWSARRGETAALAAGSVVLALVTAVLDAPGRVLVGGAALLLLALAARDLLLRPRVTAGPSGVAVRTLSGRRQLPWSRLRVRVRETRRLGVRSRLLELDTAPGPADDGVLILLGRRDLGTDPEQVARALTALRPRPEARREPASGEEDGAL